MEKEKPIEDIVAGLLPISLHWMEVQGYIERTYEKGKPTIIQITELGYRYLNSVGVLK